MHRPHLLVALATYLTCATASYATSASLATGQGRDELVSTAALTLLILTLTAGPLCAVAVRGRANPTRAWVTPLVAAAAAVPAVLAAAAFAVASFTDLAPDAPWPPVAGISVVYGCGLVVPTYALTIRSTYLRDNTPQPELRGIAAVAAVLTLCGLTPIVAAATDPAWAFAWAAIPATLCAAAPVLFARSAAVSVVSAAAAGALVVAAGLSAVTWVPARAADRVTDAATAQHANPATPVAA